MMARPRGSHAKYWPGTILLHPVLPKVSQCTVRNEFVSAENSTIAIFPESEPMTM